VFQRVDVARATRRIDAQHEQIQLVVVAVLRPPRDVRLQRT